DAYTGSRHVRFETAVATARTIGREARQRLEARIVDGDIRRGRVRRRSDVIAIGGGRRWATKSEERDRDVEYLPGVGIAGDLAVERWVARGVVDHRHGRRAVLLSEDGARHARAGAARREHELSSDEGGIVFRFVAPERDAAVRIAE